jgi:hypothetical protein
LERMHGNGRERLLTLQRYPITEIASLTLITF